MEQLLLNIARGLVVDKDSVRVTADEVNDEGVVVYHLSVAPDDMGRVIGRQGKIAREIRTLMRAVAQKQGKRINVDIVD